MVRIPTVLPFILAAVAIYVGSFCSMAPVLIGPNLLPKVSAQQEVGEEFYRGVVTWVFTKEGIQDYIEIGLGILNCESSYGQNFGTSHKGPWQFAEGTWDNTPQGLLGEDPEDPVASTEATAWMIKEGRIGEWGCYWLTLERGDANRIELPHSGEGIEGVTDMHWDTLIQVMVLIVVITIAVDYLIASWSERKNR